LRAASKVLGSGPPLQAARRKHHETNQTRRLCLQLVLVAGSTKNKALEQDVVQ
jgi:hypothetical protein